MQRFWRLAVVLVLALSVASCGHKPDAKEAAQQFFQRVASGDTQGAHGSATFAFQAEQNPRVFEQAAKELGLIGATNVEVQPGDVGEQEAKFNTVITTAKGEKRTYIATLQNESGTWRMFSLKTPRSAETGRSERTFSLVGKGASFSDALNQPMPDEKAIRRLVMKTLEAFNDAVRAQTFADFYANVSTAWQGQVTERQLQRAFQPFIDQQVDLTGALKLDPVLDVQPQITTEGLLLIAGHLPSKPYHVEFSLKFIYELPDWKLFGIDVNLRNAEGAAPPAQSAP